MKTRKAKRFLAALLAMVMVLSTFVAMPFSSYASTYSVEQLKTLLDQYESKINTEDTYYTYTSLSESYEAWYDAYTVYVGVLSGKLADTQIDSAYTALEGKMNALESWSYTASNPTPTFLSNSGTVPADSYANLLYTGTGAGQAFSTSDTGSIRFTFQVGYNPTVMLYDGVTTPKTNVMYCCQVPSKIAGGNKSRNPMACYPTTASGATDDFGPLDLVGNWKGAASTVWDFVTNYNSGTYYFGYKSGTYLAGKQLKSTISGATASAWATYSNVIAFDTNTAWATDEYCKSYTTTYWANYSGDGAASDLLSGTASVPIYVINYKALYDAMSVKGISLTSKSYSTVQTLLTAIKNLQALDPNTKFASSTNDTLATDVSAFTSELSTAVSAATTAKNSLAAVDNASYATLAGSFKAYADVYTENNSNGYWDNSNGEYDTFRAKYEAADTVLTAIVNKTDRMSNAATVNSELVAARDALQPAAQYIDDTELQALFTKYYGLTQSYYTSETYDALTAKINAALAYYNNNNYTAGITLKDDDEGRAIYATLVSDIEAAMTALRISRDATVVVNGALISYNSLMERADAIEGSKYANYDEVMAVVGNASVTIVTLESTDFTDEASMISQYIAVLQPAQDALNSLTRAFSDIDDGTIVSRVYGSTSGYSADNITTYLSNQIIETTYFKTVSGQSSYITEYDYTVDNTYYKNAGYRGAQFHGLGFGAYGQSSVSSTYGLIAIRWKEGGTCVAQSSEGVNNGVYTLGTYHEGLMKTPTTYTAGSNYINAASNTKGQTILGETTVVCKDLGVDIATFKTPDVYELIYVYDVEKQRTNTDVVQTVNIIDISDLIEKITEADALVKKYQSNAFGCFDSVSWKNFTDALAAAKQYMPYTDMTNTDIVTDCQSRYNNLVTYMAPIADLSAISTAEGSHNLIEQADTVHATCTEDGTIHYICDICGYDTTVTEAMLGHSYEVTPNNDGATHTLTCTRGDDSYVEACTPDSTGTVCEVCGQSLYDPANWDAFNAAKADMEAALLASANGTTKYTIAALTQANTDIAAISFYNYTDEEKSTVSEARQSEVDEQTNAIIAAYNALLNGVADSSVYDANISKESTLNADAYNVVEVQNAVSGIAISAQVPVNGSEYTGYNYDDYNTAFGTALTENWLPYTVTVYDYNDVAWYLTKTGSDFGYTDNEAAATQFHYGDYVTAPNPNNAQEVCAWAVNVETTNSSDTASDLIPKYMLSDVDYIFNIRGNTTLWTTSDATSDANSTYEIKFVLALDGVNTGKVIDVQYVDQGKGIRVSSCNLPDNIPFYTLDSGSDGTNTYNLKRASTTITPTTDIVIVANYISDSRGTYTITLIDEAGTTLSVQENVTFNNLVTLSAPGAAAYVNADNGRTLCIGSTYSFYACRDITVKAVSTAPTKGDVDVISAPVIDANGKVYIVGSFALPAGCTIQSYGIVLDGLGTKTNLSLADLDKANYVFNLSASKYTCGGQLGNQFTVSFNQNIMFSRGNYVAYAIYTDENGLTQYVYSDVIVGAAIAG